MEAPHRVACIDASACIALQSVDLLAIIPEIFHEVLLPIGVLGELLRGNFLDDAWTVANLPRVQVVDPGSDLPGLPHGLHRGERQVITLARLRGCIALLDENDAREVAKRLGLRVHGTLGLLLAAKAKGLIPSVRPVLEELLANGFRARADLLARVLEVADEPPL